MLSADQVLGLVAASIVLIAVPGPSVMFIVGRALSHGRASALASVAGNTTGSFVVAVLVALGLGPVLQRSDLLFQAIKWIGVLYLLWLGIDAIRTAAPPAADPDAAAGMPPAPGRPASNPWAAARTGFVVGVTNPKVFVLASVIVPQFLDRAAGSPALQLILLSLVPLSVGLVTDTAWALAAGRARTWLTTSPRRLVAIERIGGVSVLGVGLSLAAGEARL